MNPVGYLETGVLYCDDNLSRLRQFPDECIDLIYLDPPFFSNRHYEVIWGDEAEVRSFEDRWDGGLNHYLNWMEERLVELYRILRPDGSVYLHCDYHAGHYLKVAMDGIFGMSNFQNEIAWCYRGGGVPKTAFARKHDTIFFYTKGDEAHYFQPQYVPYSESTHQVTGRTGRRVNQTEIDLERGAHMPDWWADINSLQTWDRERLGYPTQKPEGLLDRIVRASSREGDIVLDPFCGCGTAMVVAERLKREWIGIDISPTAVGIMERRILKDTNGAADVTIKGLPVTEEAIRGLKPFEFQNWVIQRLHGRHSPRKSGDMGIDGWSFFENLPIQVKQSENVGRNTVDNFETAVRRDRKHKGYIVALSFGRGAREEAARTKREGKVEVELVTLADLLQDQSESAASSQRTPSIRDLFPERRAASFLDLPLPETRKPEARPSFRDLVASDLAAVG